MMMIIIIITDVKHIASLDLIQKSCSNAIILQPFDETALCSYSLFLLSSLLSPANSIVRISLDIP